jgi:hypothetical protein
MKDLVEEKRSQQILSEHPRNRNPKFIKAVRMDYTHFNLNVTNRDQQPHHTTADQDQL